MIFNIQNVCSMQMQKTNSFITFARTLVILINILISVKVFSQESSSDMNNNSVQMSVLKIFVNGDRPDDAYMRKEIPYVNFVRDQALCDVQIMITSIRTASGGVNYEVEFIGKKKYKSLNYDLRQSSNQEETYYQRRKRTVNVMKLGLLPYLSQNGNLDDFKLTYEGPMNTEQNILKNENDPWHHWIFQLGADGSFYKEATVTDYAYSTSVDASYVTDKWKIRNNLYSRNHVNHFLDSVNDILAVNSYTNLQSSFVKSIDGRWSSGIFGRIQHSTYRNYKVAYDVAPAIEYNIFPWEDVAKREFTVAYHIGIQHNEYIEPTIYEKTSETLGFHSININFRMIQPWGNIDAALEGSDFLQNPKYYSIEFNTHVSARLTKNLSFRVSINAQSIHDQIYLPQGDASLEEILLQQRSLATTYQYSLSAGFNFTFGSIYNNVVNRRL
jgi:hypothetical protein